MIVLHSVSISAVVTLIFMAQLYHLTHCEYIFDGDIIVDDTNSHTNRHRSKRAAIAHRNRIWDYGIVPYEIDARFDGYQRAELRRAMLHWENFTCIKFVERSSADEHFDYIQFTELECGCCSYVGRKGNGKQHLSIGKNCHKMGVIVHELGHAIGFWHEHTRPGIEFPWELGVFSYFCPFFSIVHH